MFFYCLVLIIIFLIHNLIEYVTQISFFKNLVNHLETFHFLSGAYREFSLSEGGEGGGEGGVKYLR